MTLEERKIMLKYETLFTYKNYKAKIKKKKIKIKKMTQ